MSSEYSYTVNDAIYHKCRPTCINIRLLKNWQTAI